MFNRYLALVLTIALMGVCAGQMAWGEPMACSQVFDVITENLIPEGLSKSELIQLEFKLLETHGPSKLGLSLEHSSFVPKLNELESLSESERYAIGVSFEKRNQNFSYEGITRFSPAQVMDVFSFWVALGFPKEALRFYQSHSALFEVYIKHKVFFRALRDLLQSNTKTADVLEVQKLILEFRSGPNFMSQYLYGDQIVSALSSSRRLLYPPDFQLYNRYQLDLKNALENLASAWARSKEAQNWIKSLQLGPK